MSLFPARPRKYKSWEDKKLELAAKDQVSLYGGGWQCRHCNCAELDHRENKSCMSCNACPGYEARPECEIVTVLTDNQKQSYVIMVYELSPGVRKQVERVTCWGSRTVKVRNRLCEQYSEMEYHRVTANEIPKGNMVNV